MEQGGKIRHALSGYGIHSYLCSPMLLFKPNRIRDFFVLRLVSAAWINQYRLPIDLTLRAKNLHCSKRYANMLRFASWVILTMGFFALSAYRTDYPKFGDQPFPVNTTVAQFFSPFEREAPSAIEASEQIFVDSSAEFRVLMLNYSAYNSAYADNLKRIIKSGFPNALITEFSEGTAEELSTALAGQDLTILAYPSNGNAGLLESYGKSLQAFAQRGGGVVITGTHDFGVLQRYNLFDLDFGYYSASPSVRVDALEHPILLNVEEEFSMQSFAYPLDISDSSFVSLATVRGYPTLGYKAAGLGKIVYVGFEFYYDETEPGRIFTNTLRWLLPVRPNLMARSIKRTEEILYAGSGFYRPEQIDAKVYPNPYVAKANLDFELKKPASVTLVMTDETGRQIGVLLPRKLLNSGTYRIELPNVAPGVYFIQCQFGNTTQVKKVVKLAE